MVLLSWSASHVAVGTGVVIVVAVYFLVIFCYAFSAGAAKSARFAAPPQPPGPRSKTKL